MPGIFGIIPKKEVDQTVIDKHINQMKNILSHQDWYFSEIHTENRYGLGIISVRNNFSINQLEYGNDKFFVLISGYIYKIKGKSCKEYENKDYETAKNILDVFLNEGENSLIHIEGNYHVIIYNQSKEILYLFNDIIGPNRVYYADLPDFFVIAPETKAISQLGGFKKDIDWKAVSDFLHNSYVLGNSTFFSTIKSLSSASILKFEKKKNNFSVNKYWMPKYIPKQNSMDEAIDDVFDLLKDSMNEKLSENDSIISPISGGLDSRIILAILNENSKNYSIKPVTYAQKFSDEYKIGKKVSEQLHLSGYLLLEITPESVLNKFLSAVWLSDGMSRMTNAHLLLFPEMVSKDYNYLFNGIYGGPTNYSALYYSERHLINSFSAEEKVKDIRRVMSISSEPFDGIFKNEINKIIKESVFNSIEIELQKTLDVSDEFANQRDFFFIENRMRRGICQGGLYKFFWEEQIPLSNYALYKYYLSMAPELKIGRDLLKGILIRKYPELAKIKDANTGLNLYQKPSAAYNFKKKAEFNFNYYLSRLSGGRIDRYNKTTYAHYDKWLRKNSEHEEFYAKYLFSSAISDSGIVNTSKLSTLFRDTLKGGVGYYHILNLATFAIWYHYFVAENDVGEINNYIKSLPKTLN